MRSLRFLRRFGCESISFEMQASEHVETFERETSGNSLRGRFSKIASDGLIGSEN
jgi:hypothetical protein